MTDQELDRLLSQAAPMARDLWLSSLPGDGELPQAPGHGRGLAEQPVQLLLSHTATPNPSRASRSRALARDTVRSTADTVMSSTRAISRLSSPRSYFSSSTVR